MQITSDLPESYQQQFQTTDAEEDPLMNTKIGALPSPPNGSTYGERNLDTQAQNQSPWSEETTDQVLLQETEPTVAEVHRYRDYEDETWSTFYQELVYFRNQHGHCRIPHTYTPNMPLSRWSKRQRCLYRQLQRGEHSSLSVERMQALNRLGFVWDSQGAAWEAKFDELREFRNATGHCNVPYQYKNNPKLASWVKAQRRQYQKLLNNEHSSMSPARFQKLKQLGFAWRRR